MNISSLNHLRADKRVKFKEELVNNRSLTIVSYMISDAEFWKKPLAIETRGAVFDTLTGECVCRPFEKFFNVGENESSMPHLINYENALVFEKRDGSMVTPVAIDGCLLMKTKKSFYSDVAMEATSVATEDVWTLSWSLIKRGWTPIFEYTSPNWKIVLDYGPKPEFVLLAARNMKSGEYMDWDELVNCAMGFDVPLISKIDISKNDILWTIKNATQFEGFVILQPNGVRVKQKTNWYLINHRLMTELRERDVALAVVDEVIDDIKSELTNEGKDLSEVLEIENRVVSEIEGIVSATESLAEQMKDEWSRKDIALKYKDNKYFSLAIKLYEGKEPRYTQFWKSRFLNNFSLRCIYNKNFSAIDEE